MNHTSKTTDAAESESYLGVIVSWDFGCTRNAQSVSILREALRDSLRKHGFDDMLVAKQSSASDALHDASQISWTQRCGIDGRVIVEKLRAEKGVPASYGVMVTDVTREDASSFVGARIRVSQFSASGYEILPPVDRPDFEERAQKVALDVVDYASKIRNSAGNKDISFAISNIVKQIGCISMRRNGGGAYLLPSGKQTDQFVALLDDLESMTNNASPENAFYGHVTILHRDARNLKTWGRSAELTFAHDLKALQDELADMSSRDNVRDSTWDKKRAECAGLMVRAQSFAHLMEGQIDELNASIAALVDEFGTAQQQAREALDKGKKAFARIGLDTPEQEPQEPATKAPNNMDRLGALLG